MVNNILKNAVSWWNLFKQKHRILPKLLFGCLILVFLLSALVGSVSIAGSSSKNSMDALSSGNESLGYAPESMSKSNDMSISESTNTNSSESLVASDVSAVFDKSKLIYSGSVSLNIDDYGDVLKKITDYVEPLGGFVQNTDSNYNNDYYRSNNIATDNGTGFVTIRVPSDKFAESMTYVQTLGSVIESDTNSTNISQQYGDTKIELDGLKIEEERLLNYLKSATNITDMLTIEKELTRVRTDINSLSTTIKNWDIEMSYSTITLNLYKNVVSSTSFNSPFSGLLLKINEGVVSSINVIAYGFSSLIVLVFRLIPFLVIFGLIYIIFVKIRKYRGKNDVSKKL